MRVPSSDIRTLILALLLGPKGRLYLALTLFSGCLGWSMVTPPTCALLLPPAVACGFRKRHHEWAGGLAPRLGVPLMSLPPTLEKHSAVTDLLGESFAGVVAGVWVTTGSPRYCFCSLALYLNTGLGPAIGPVMTHELKVCINHRAGEILRHEVNRIIGSQNLPHLKLMDILFLLDP